MDLRRGDRVIATDAAGQRLTGVVMLVLSNGWVLVEVGTAGKHRFNHDARVFDAIRVESSTEQVKRA